MWAYFKDYEKVISIYRNTKLPAEMWRSQPPTAQPRTQFKPVSMQLLWLDWQLLWPVKRRLGLLQCNWDIHPKPMSNHWGRVMHICVSKPSHYGPLIMAWRQFRAKPWSEAIFIVWLTAPLGTKDAISIKIQTFFIQENAFENVICRIEYASASVCSMKSSEVSFVQNTHFCCLIIFKLQVAQN